MSMEKFTENLIYSQVFSFEVLNYFDSITTNENYEWIVKYFDVLMKEENKTAEKFNEHHIRPCCTFKDETHKNRTESKPLADKFDGNLIKLSIYNHLFAHFYLWKIFNIWDLKSAFQRMSSQGKNINNLTEEELGKIAKLKEECTKKNRTKEEKKEHDKQRYKNKRVYILKQHKNYYENNKEKTSKRQKNYRINNKNKIKVYYENNKEKAKQRYKINKKEILEKAKQRNNQKCYDPIKEDVCYYNALKDRAYKNKELYKNVMLKTCLIK